MKTILTHHSTTCEHCEREAVLVLGRYEDWYAITHKTFAAYCKEQLEQGINVTTDFGCQVCNPL